MAVEVSTVSNYVYCLSYDGLWRLKIPRCDIFGQYHEIEIERVFTSRPSQLAIKMGMVAMENYVYMFGGLIDYASIWSLNVEHPSWNFFTLNTHNQSTDFLHYPKRIPSNTIKPIVDPIVIHANDNIFLLSQLRSSSSGGYAESLSFQSFDPTDPTNMTNLGFEVLPLPPLQGNGFEIVGHFAICEYIYVFINEEAGPTRLQSAFYFNTTSLQWAEANEMWAEHRRRGIPIPLYHRGDTPVSDIFPDSTRIMLAFNQNSLIAYRASLSQDGHLVILSWRPLREISPWHYAEYPSTLSHLLDMGDALFCAIYSSHVIPLRVDVFKFNFKRERVIQAEIIPIPNAKRISARILCSRSFSDRIPGFGAYSLVSTGAPVVQSVQSCGIQIAAGGEEGGGEEGGGEVADGGEHI